MAGHSQFKNIMHRKGAQDAKRAKVFTKIIREITVAAKISGNDPFINPRLRIAISNAKQYNLPKDKIDAAIKKAVGNGCSDNYFEMVYSGYGPANAAIIVECMTDNKNRSSSEMKYIFSRHNGSLGVAEFLFNKYGLIIYDIRKIDKEVLFDYCLSGAIDLIESDDNVKILCEIDSLYPFSKKLFERFGEAIFSGIGWHAKDFISLAEGDIALIEKLIDALQDNDDVQRIWTNVKGFEICV
ncbi:YebC/PmpR family DNA-binding transcriptional regulator [Candidatus Gromoviella agglomerans]|uniref:YebC/PmpR family DNA-binding transcriptional regulator n=1 Tax=Candidatus Gromoviella agglomerans TaxID=2806609 RepID=UPI001E634AFD|nr:YebC/PmpR family DNA-binding transcriptional regulator [Candidatus Gromoviella agglomerans]